MYNVDLRKILAHLLTINLIYCLLSSTLNLKLTAFADDKMNVVEMLISLSDRIENMMGKGENAGYQHFLLFSQCFQKPSLSGSLRVGILW